MSGTYGDLKAAIVRELFNRTDLTAEIQAAIQAAISHYQKDKFFFSENQQNMATVNLQPNYGLPSDFGFIDGMTIIYSTYPIRLERRDWKTMQDLMVNTTFLVGQPTEYAIYGGELWFWPTPNGAYPVQLYQNFKNAPPTQDTDTSVWTDDAEELIRSRAVGDILVHDIKRDAAMQEFAQVAGEGYFSGRERIAHKQLLTYSAKYLSSGRINPQDF